MKIIDNIFKAFLLVAFVLAGIYIFNIINKARAMNMIIGRLSADSRIAEVVVSSKRFDPELKKYLTTVKFVEFDSKGNTLPEKYFTFQSDIIQFQALVIRFDDYYVRRGHPLKGKSAYIFMKAYSILDDRNIESFSINNFYEIPSGYNIYGSKNIFEKLVWKEFWEYALNDKKSKSSGIKNVQIEAPGTKFAPGFIYTIKIEHDGGIRIDAKELPAILKSGN